MSAAQPRIAVRLPDDVRAALDASRAVVALESSVLAQGLAPPANREAACRMLNAVRSRGAVAAVAAVVRGTPTVGIDEGELERFLGRDGVLKLSARDLPIAVARGADGATTVAASLVLARAVGVDVFATGGIGGVHRAPAAAPVAVRDESADLLELTRSPLIVVCAGMKSILDIEGTSERLETLGVPVVGYRTSELPAFLYADTGLALAHRVETAEEVADLFVAHRALGGQSALLVVQPPPPEAALTAVQVEDAVANALRRAHDNGVRGGAVTPLLLAEVERATGGRSVGANLALLERNAALAAEVAVALAARRWRSS